MKTKRKQILIAVITLAIVFMLGGLIRLLATEDVEDLAEPVEILTEEEKIAKVRDDNPETSEYLVTDENISRILPHTKVEKFISEFENQEKIKVYKDEACSEEVTSGEVCTGMYAKYENNGRIFEISVLGDINEKNDEVNNNEDSEKTSESQKNLSGDGELNEIECTRIIRGVLGSENWKIENDTELKSADITCNKEIEENDVKSAVQYIVFGNIEAPKVEKIEAPSLTVVEGHKNENGSFIGSTKVKLTQNDENGVKNTYRILKYQEEYLEISTEGIIELNETGVYTIVAYTYGELNNKSKGALKTVVVDNTSYDLTLVAGENIVSVKGAGKYKVGEKVEIDAVVKTDGSGYEYKWGMWTSENTGIVDNQASQKAEIIMPSENITLIATAIRSLVNYSIEYNLNGGSLEEGIENPIEYTVETPTFILNNPSKEGYRFDGWTTEEEEEPQKIVTIQSGTIGNKVYTANWTEIGPVSYKVNHYKENIEGSEYELVETENLSAKIGEEVKAEKKEYNGFSYDEDNSANNLTGIIKENEELVLEVYYKRNVYTLNLDKNENIESVEGNGEYKFEAPVKIGATLKEEAGYRFEFDKWESSNGELLSNQKNANTEFTMPAGDLTLTANAIKYAREDTEYKVEYYYQENGVYSTTPNDSVIRTGTTGITVSVTDIDKEIAKVGYIFDEANEKNVLSGVVTAGESQLVLKVYFKEQLKVSYLPGNHGTFKSQITKGIDYGTETPAFARELTCDVGYTFAGWDKEISKTVTKNVEYVATWQTNIYQISYNLNGGNLEGTNPNTYTVESDDITLLNPTRSGYIFKGWSGTDIDSITENVTISKGSTGDRAYIANWEAEEYTIAYELNGGSLETGVENPTSYTVETPTFTLYNPSKTGYEFLGWKGTGIDGTTAEVTVPTGSTGNREYIATWSKNTNTAYRVEYYLEKLEGSGYDCVETLNLEGETEQYVEAEIKTFTGFTFDEKNENNKLYGNILGDGSLVLKVYYTRNTYNLTLYTEKANFVKSVILNQEEAQIGDLGYASISNSFKYGETVEINATLQEKEGYTYTFSEWTTNNAEVFSSQTSKNISFEMPAGDLTLTAKATETANISSYMVEYYYENMEGNYPETATETKGNIEALTGTIAVLEESDKVSNKVGYEYDTTAENVLTAEVKGDGTTKLKVYFRRKEYTLTVVKGENIEKVEISDTTEQVKTVKYGDEVTVKATLVEELGYEFEFETWVSSNKELLDNQNEQNATINMPAGNLTLTATAKKTALEVDYIVEYYYQVNGQYPETAESTITRQAKTGTEISITSEDKNATKDGYVYDENASLKIEMNTVKADGTTTLKVYFKQQFKVTYKPGDKGLFADTTIEKIDYGTVTPEFSGDLAGEAGYIFIGWEPELEETVTKDAEYVAVWSEITVPTITHTPTIWTNQDVTVTITAPENMSSLDIEYRVGNSEEYTIYEGGFIVGENCTIYARLTDGTTTGEEVSHDITNIDKVAPKITNTNIDTSNSDFAKISATLIDNLSGVIKYGISTSEELEPEYEMCLNTLNIDVEFEEIYGNGTYYIWVKDAAGNIAKQKIEINHIQFYNVAKIVSAPEGYENLVGTEYTTLELALQTSDEAAQIGNVKIEIIHNIYNEDNTILSGRDYTIDLHNYTVKNQNESPALTVEGKLQIVDEGQAGTGKLVSLYDSGVYITLEGEFTLGTDDNGNPSTISPIIEGLEYGVEKEINDDAEGIFNFYDGKIIGQIAIKAQTINDTPLLYDPTVITNSETGKQESTLAIVSGIEAVIGKKRYMLVEDAIADANNNIGTQEEQIEITIVKDISKEQEVLVNSTKNIKLDLNGYVFTGTSSGYVIRNQGQLEIIDSSETIDEETGDKIQGTGVITGSAYNTIINETVESTASEYENIDLSTAVSNGEYYFESTEDGLISNNSGVTSTANSYIELDLTDKVGIYEVVVNAEIGSYARNGNGYITVRNNTTTPTHNDTEGRKVYIKGIVEATDYKFNLVGGEKYYIHLGYYNWLNSSRSEDCFTINSIKIGRLSSTTGVLTLTSGTIENTKVGTKSVYYSAIQNEGELYVNGGKISSTGNYSTLIDNAEETNAGFVQINNGKLIGTYIGIRNFYGGVLDIYGGEIQTKYNCVKNYGNMCMYNGHVNSTSDYCVYNDDYGEMTIENGYFTGGSGIYNTASDYEYNNITIKNAIIEVNGSGIYNNTTGTIHIENATINKASNAIYNRSSGKIIIDDIDITSDNITGETIYNYGSGTITINGGTIETTNAYKECIYNAGTGTININGGTLKSNCQYACINMDSKNSKSGILNITGGHIEGTSKAILLYSGDNINITGGTIIATNGVGISSSGTINLGTKGDEVNTETPVIKGTTNAITNHDGTLNYYDGVLIGQENYVVSGVFTEIEENCELVKEIKDDGLQYITLGIPNYYVARISENDKPDVSELNSSYYKLENGYYYFITLKSAVESCSESNQSTVEIIDDLWVYRTIDITENQDIIIKYNDKTVRIYNDEIAFNNHGKLQLINETEGTYGNIFSHSNNIIKNEENAEMHIDNICLDYYEIQGSSSNYNKIISNNGNLEINNTYITSSEGTSSSYAYVIWNGESGTLATDNLTITSIQSAVKIYNEGIDKEDDAENIIPTVTIKNTAIGSGGSSQTGIKNNSSGSMYISDSTISETYAITNSSNGYIEIENCNLRYQVNNDSTGKILIKGENTVGVRLNNNEEGILEVQAGTFEYSSAVVNNSGKLIITGGKFICNASVYTDVGIYNKKTGVATVSGENTYIGGTKSGVYNEGTITINDARIVSTYNTGIKNTSTGIVNFGTADGNVKFKPTVYGKLYGVYNEGTFNFYDGIIDGPTDASIGVKLDVTEEEYIRVIYQGEYNYDDGTESGYTVASGREISVLEQIEVAHLTSTDKNYTSLKGALADAEDTDTITVLTNATLVSSDESLIIKDGQNITFDLAGFTISAGNSNTFVNNGTLKITDSSSYEDDEGNKVVGSIINGADVLVKNNGELTIEEVNLELTTGGSKDEYKTLIENNGTANINSGTLTTKGSYSYVVNATEDAITNIETATLEDKGAYSNVLNLAENTETTIGLATIKGGIYNSANGKVTTNGTTISAEVYNNADGTITLKNTTTTGGVTNNGEGIININGGTIDYASYSAITNNSTGTINVAGGSISGRVVAIYNLKEGTINIDGTQELVAVKARPESGSTTRVIYNDGSGNINIKGNVTLGSTNYTGYGMYNDTGTITLGDEDNVNNNVKINPSSIGVYNLSGTFNYYGGTITAGSKAVQGRISNIPEGYQVLRSVNEDSKEVYEIGKTENVAEANGTTYATLKQAFDNTTTGTIKLLKNIVITEEDVINIKSNKDVTLDLNGNLIKAHNYTETFINRGKFTITDSSENAEGTIEAENVIIVKNTGEFTMAGGNIIVHQHQTEKIIYNTVDTETNSNGTLNITGGVIALSGARTNSYIIYSDSPNKIVMSGGTINITDGGNRYYTLSGIYLEKAGAVLEITGGKIISKYDEAGIYVDRNANNIEINIAGNGEVASKVLTYSNTKINISDECVISESIVTYGKESEINVTGGNVGQINGNYNTTLNIYDGAKLNYNGSVISEVKTVNIYGGEINGDVYMSSGTLNMTGGTINGISYGVCLYNSSTATITGGTINASEGPGIKIYSSNATLTLGENTGGYPSTKVPEITGYTYGVENTGGTFNFYDGILKGSTYATSGTVTNTPELFTTQYSEEGTVATLGIMATFEQVALVNGIYYDDLESAIAAAITTDAKIEMCKDIILQKSIEIPSGSSISIELAGNSIYGYTEDATIINNGTLTILDSTSDTISYSAINNKSGIAIKNNGVLTIGNSEDDVNTNSPRIIGSVIAIANNGTLNFFDGQIGIEDEANAEAIVSGSLDVTLPTGYTVGLSGWNYILEEYETSEETDG